MGEWYVYNFIKGILNSYQASLHVSFNDMREDTDNNCGIYLDGIPTSKRSLKNGTYYNDKLKVHIEAVSANTRASILEILSTLNKAKQSLILSSNTVIHATEELGGNLGLEESELGENEEESGDCLVIVDVSLISGVSHYGKNKLGLSKYGLDLYITYCVIERSE